MKRLCVLIGLSVMLMGMSFSVTAAAPDAAGKLVWNTFWGSGKVDSGGAIANDSAGNVYIAGSSSASWGNPIRSFGAQFDTFVAKLNPEGELLWNTFLGGDGGDSGNGIALDSTGNVYVAGSSDQAWGTPVNPFSQGNDAFVAKLDSNGALMWNTFIGGVGREEVMDIALDLKGRAHISGRTTASWGEPVRPFTGVEDAFVARVSPKGVPNWHTFLGGDDYDMAMDLVVGEAGIVYVTGWSDGTWGTPLLPYVAYTDTFVAKLGAHGVLKWNTFLGGANADSGEGITLDHKGAVYVSGGSRSTGAFVAKLTRDGLVKWNHSFGNGQATDIYVDAQRIIYVSGVSGETWGNPVRPYTAENDGFAAQLDGTGAVMWNTFLGGDEADAARGLSVDQSAKVYVSGNSSDEWGTPKHPFAGAMDVFVVKLQ